MRVSAGLQRVGLKNNYTVMVDLDVLVFGARAPLPFFFFWCSVSDTPIFFTIFYVKIQRRFSYVKIQRVFSDSGLFSYVRESEGNPHHKAS